MSHLASNYAKIRNSKPFTTVKISMERYNFKDKNLLSLFEMQESFLIWLPI